MQMFLCTFASCFDLTTHLWFDSTTDQRQSFRIRVRKKQGLRGCSPSRERRSLATSSADENVAWRAYFDGASNTEAPAACRSHAVHVHGTSRLPARGRCTPSDVTSRVGAVRATSRRGASGGITGVVGAVRRRLPTRGPARRQYVFFMVLKCVDLLTPARGAPYGPTVKPQVVLAVLFRRYQNKRRPKGRSCTMGRVPPPDRGPYPP